MFVYSKHKCDNCDFNWIILKYQLSTCLECGKEICTRCTPSRVCSDCQRVGVKPKKRTEILGKFAHFALYFIMINLLLLLLGVIIGFSFSLGEIYFKWLAIVLFIPSAILDIPDVLALAFWAKD
ncbi:MAG: hypothetical protein ACTSWX_01340 [Promethearchaeota archaeon]